MKKNLLTAFLLIVLSLSAFAGTTFDGSKEKKASSYVLTKFADDYKGATDVTWEISSKFQKATFKLNGEETTVFYNWQDEHIASTQQIAFEKLSPTALKNIVKNFGGYNVGEVIKYKSDETVYFINLKNAKESFIIKVDANDNASFFKRLK